MFLEAEGSSLNCVAIVAAGKKTKQNNGLEVHRPEFRVWIFHYLAVWPQVSLFTSLGLSCSFHLRNNTVRLQCFSKRGSQNTCIRVTQATFKNRNPMTQTSTTENESLERGAGGLHWSKLPRWLLSPLTLNTSRILKLQNAFNSKMWGLLD